jgi:hypothetical protein
MPRCTATVRHDYTPAVTNGGSSARAHPAGVRPCCAGRTAVLRRSQVSAWTLVVVRHVRHVEDRVAGAGPVAIPSMRAPLRAVRRSWEQRAAANLLPLSAASSAVSGPWESRCHRQPARTGCGARTGRPKLIRRVVSKCRLPGVPGLEDRARTLQCGRRPASSVTCQAAIVGGDVEGLTVRPMAVSRYRLTVFHNGTGRAATAVPSAVRAGKTVLSISYGMNRTLSEPSRRVVAIDGHERR